MDSDEREIYDYLKTWPKVFVSAREISRRAGGKRRFRDDPHWAKPALTRLVEKGLLEVDSFGHYRIKPAETRAKRQRWVSPQIARILRDSGRKFGGDVGVTEIDAQNES
jgi:hypothetical protein